MPTVCAILPPISHWSRVGSTTSSVGGGPTMGGCRKPLTRSWLTWISGAESKPPGRCRASGILPRCPDRHGEARVDRGPRRRVGDDGRRGMCRRRHQDLNDGLRRSRGRSLRLPSLPCQDAAVQRVLAARAQRRASLTLQNFAGILPGLAGEYLFGVMVRAPVRRCIMVPMQLATGTVVGGKVVVEGDPLPEGTIVTILAREADETFEVPPELEAELLESIAQADRGETISADELLERLRRIA